MAYIAIEPGASNTFPIILDWQHFYVNFLRILIRRVIFILHIYTPDIFRAETNGKVLSDEIKKVLARKMKKPDSGSRTAIQKILGLEW